MTPRAAHNKDTGSDTPSAGKQKELLEVCSQIGALIIGQRHDRMSQAVELLQKRASAVVLEQYLDDWLPQFEEHYAALEKVIGKGLKLDEGDLVNDLKQKVAKAGYASLRDFLVEQVMPLVSYHGLLLFLNNDAGVALPGEVREEVVERMQGINKVLGGACAAMVLQDSMGI